MSAGPDGIGGMHDTIVGISPGRGTDRWFAWCETCARASPPFDEHRVAADLVALHLIDPRASPVATADPDRLRQNAAEVLAPPPWPWL